MAENCRAQFQMFKLSNKLNGALVFDEIEISDHTSSHNHTNNHEDINFMSSASIISPIPSISPTKSTSEWEQLRQAQECLETSACYMNEIESFFQELSTQRPTPFTTTNSANGRNGWISAESSTFSLESYDNLDFDNLAAANAIDPSIFNLKDLADQDEEQEFANFSNFNMLQLGTTKSLKKPSSKPKFNSADESSSPSSSTSSESHFKAPKFYSRSGQVADPNRGPCHNCHTTLTCYWRKLKGQYHCNACTLFFKRNKYHRSGDAAEKPIKRRNRKSKYSQ